MIIGVARRTHPSGVSRGSQGVGSRVGERGGQERYMRESRGPDAEMRQGWDIEVPWETGKARNDF